MVQWVMACVSTVSYSVLVKDLLMPYFKVRKGLRLGDRISPYLFAMAMEYLSRRLNDLKDYPDFIFYLKCSRTNTVYLLFADDVLIFYKGDPSSIITIKD